MPSLSSFSFFFKKYMLIVVISYGMEIKRNSACLLEYLINIYIMVIVDATLTISGSAKAVAAILV